MNKVDKLSKTDKLVPYIRHLKRICDIKKVA